MKILFCTKTTDYSLPLFLVFLCFSLYFLLHSTVPGLSTTLPPVARSVLELSTEDVIRIKIILGYESPWFSLGRRILMQLISLRVSLLFSRYLTTLFQIHVVYSVEW
jgi:hypothetical protein